VLHELATIAPVTAVRGNIDYGALTDLPLTALLELAGRRIAALHIAGSPTRPNAEARDLVERERPDVLVVGHSHIPVAGRTLGTLWINPGAAGQQGFHTIRTAAVLRIDAQGGLSLYEITLGPRGRERATEP
jgi:putative phosphoesterase